MISIKNYYDSANLINNAPIPLPYKGSYEDLLNYQGIIIETFTNKNDILHVDFLNNITFLSDASSTPLITETYALSANTTKTLIIQPKLRYYRIRLTTSVYNAQTDNRKITCRIINTNTLPYKIYGSENMPITTDTSGNLLLPSIENLIGETNTLLENLQVSIDLSGVSIAVDMSGTNLILTEILNDVSGFRFDTSNNLLISEMNNFIVNTARNKTTSRFINIIADNGGIVLNGVDGLRDFVYGPTDASGSFYIFNSIQNNIKLSSSSALDTTANSILISGLDVSYNEISETLQLNGTSQVTSSNQYFRLNSLELITSTPSGLTYETPLNGNITITDSSSNTFGIINLSSGKRCAGVYTVPAGHKLLITKIEFSEENGQSTTVYMYTRNPSLTNKKFTLIGKYYFINEREINKDSNPFILNEKTDLLLRIKTDGVAFCNITGILSI